MLNESEPFRNSNDDLSNRDVQEMARLRVIEAADTVRRSYGNRGAPSQKITWWPDISDPSRFADDGSESRPTSNVRTRPDAAALSRADEVEKWIADFISDDKVRFALTNWAMCILSGNHGHSFVSWCEKNGVNRRTANRHVSKALKGIARKLCQGGILLRAPDMLRVSQFLPKEGTSTFMVGRVESWCFFGETIELKDLPEKRDLTWSEKQNARRRQQAAAKADKV